MKSLILPTCTFIIYRKGNYIQLTVRRSNINHHLFKFISYELIHVYALLTHIMLKIDNPLFLITCIIKIMINKI